MRKERGGKIGKEENRKKGEEKSRGKSIQEKRRIKKIEREKVKIKRQYEFIFTRCLTLETISKQQIIRKKRQIETNKQKNKKVY